MGRDTEPRTQAARSRLRAMRQHFERRLDGEAFGGVRERLLEHGLRLSSSSALHAAFADVCLCEQSQEYLLLERGVAVQRFSVQGKQLRPGFALEASATFCRVLWCRAAGCLAGYDPEDELVWLRSAACEPLQPPVRNDFRTRALHYEATRNELVVVGTDQAVKYSLQEPDKELEPSKPVSYGDPEFGPTWQLECSALQPPSIGSPCRLIASYLTTLYVLALEQGEDADADERPNFLARRANASPAAITALLFHEPAGWIVAGDQQGNVVAYNLRLERVMTAETAHRARVAGLRAHPSICGFLSYASDGLQVWSCNLRGRLEAFGDLGGSVAALAVSPASAALVVLAARRLTYLAMQQLYCFFAPLTSGAKYMHSTHNPMYSTKTIVVSKDNSVRLFSSDGNQLNVQILPENILNLVSAVYCGSEDLLFTIILKSGEILVSDTSVCPMKFKGVFVSNGVQVTSIAGYEFFDEIRNEDDTSTSPKVFYLIGIRIFAGTKDGNILVLNNVMGKHESICPAHCGSVIQLRSSSVTHRLVSLGIDNCVKVWRIMADLVQPLHLFYEVHFTVPVIRVATMGLILCVVNSFKNSNLHQLLMYDMKERERLEHRNTDDHSSAIVNMITSETLTICATSSLDNTIRIWSHENCLVNILNVNLCAWNITFSSVTGDIVFGAGRHLYKIPHENYLAPYYRAKISTSELSENECEKKVSEDLKYQIYTNEVDRSLMLHPVSSLPLASIDISNSENPQVDLLIQKQNCELIETRDEDIKKMKDYLVTSSQVIANRALMTTQAWEEYKNELLSSFTRVSPKVPEYKFQSIAEANAKEEKTFNETGVFKMLFGYGLENLKNTENFTDILLSCELPTHGFLSNSILYKHKEPEIPKVYAKPARRVLTKYIYPPKYTKGSQESIEKRQSIRLSQLVMTEGANGDQEST